MSDLNFQVKISVNKEKGTVTAVYFQMREGKATRVLELADGKAFANYNSTGKLLGIELLAPCQVTALDHLFKKEPKVIKEFLMRTAPPEMLKAG